MALAILEARQCLLFHRVNSQHRSTSVALGAKRTFDRAALTKTDLRVHTLTCFVEKTISESRTIVAY